MADKEVFSDESEEDSKLQDGAEHQLRDRTGGGEPSTVQGDVADGGSSEIPRINKIIQQPLTVKMGVEGRGLYGRNPNPNRYRLQFESESKEEVERRKRVAKTVPITPLAEVRYTHTRTHARTRTHTRHVFMYAVLSMHTSTHRLR